MDYTFGKLIVFVATEAPFYYLFWPVVAFIGVGILRKLSIH